jgi:hypothetical protein
MNDLIEIGKKYPSSKNVTGFLEIYENYFKELKEKKINILEIGVENGDSLRIWRDYFSNANICGLDIVKKNFTINNVEILCGDQSDHKFLDFVIEKYKKFDIIIDDGCHVSNYIINTFGYLFDYLSDGGLYVIEDLQTSYIPRYGGSRINLNKKNTSMNFIKSLSDSINYEHNDKPFFKKKKFDGLIKSVHTHQNISFIEKGNSLQYFHPEIKKENFINKLKKIASYFYK